jgi:hypothetical protein
LEHQSNRKLASTYERSIPSVVVNSHFSDRFPLSSDTDIFATRNNPHLVLCEPFREMVRKGKDKIPEVEEHAGGGYITVTAQQSRYALDAVDTPASKEVGHGESSGNAAINLRRSLSKTCLSLSLVSSCFRAQRSIWSKHDTMF